MRSLCDLDSNSPEPANPLRAESPLEHEQQEVQGGSSTQPKRAPHMEGTLMRKAIQSLLGVTIVTLAATVAAEPSTPRVTFDHKGPQRTAIHRLALQDGEAFEVVITNTAEACFDYSVSRVVGKRAPQLTGGLVLRPKVLTLVHDKRYGGYIVSIQRSSTDDDDECAQAPAASLENSSVIISVETPSWELAVSGGFTVNGLTNPVYGSVKNDAGQDIVVEDLDARDDASLGVASLLHVYHQSQPPWVPSLGFGLGINEASKPAYYIGAFWRLGRVAMIGGGAVIGSVARLPVGVEVGGELSDPNLLANLPTRVETQWFVAISFSFLGGREPFEKPFAPPQEAGAE